MKLRKLVLGGSASVKANKELVRFAIVTVSGRSGSNLLVNILNRHRPESFQCLGEVFHPKMIAATEDQFSGLTVEQRNADPVGFLQLIEQRVVTANPDVYGFGMKIFANHNETALEHIFQSGKYRVIVLGRENLLAQFSSKEIAEQTGKWAKWDKGSTGSVKVEFSQERFKNQLRYVSKNEERIREAMRGSDAQWARVTYKGVSSGEDWGVIGELLGVGALNPKKIDLKKQNTNAIIDRFTNPDTVMEFLNEIGHPEWAEE